MEIPDGLPDVPLDMDFPGDLSETKSRDESLTTPAGAKTPEVLPLLSVGDEEDRDKELEDEASVFFGDDKQEGKESTDWSQRTKKMLTFLSNQLKNKEEIEFNKLVEGKRRKVAAAVFYQLLVLKSHSCIDLQQEEPYGEILVKKDENFGTRFQPRKD